MHIRRISVAKYPYPYSFKQGNYYPYPIRSLSVRIADIRKISADPRISARYLMIIVAAPSVSSFKRHVLEFELSI